MAINFGNTGMEGGITPSVAVQAPVQDDSGAVLAQSFAPAAKAIGAIAGSIFQQNQANEQGKVLTNYENELLDLADAVDQGSMDTNQAMIWARNLRRQYLSNAPALQEDFDKIWTNFVDTNGLGNVVKAGTLEQQAQDALTTEAIKNNYPSVESYKEFLANKNINDALNQQLVNLQANNQIIPESLKQQALASVTALASSAFPSAQKQINDAMAQIAANPANKAEIAQVTLTSLQQQVAQIGFLGQNADTAFIIKPIIDLMTSFQEWADGTIETTVLENEVKYTAAVHKVMAYSTPEVGQYLAAFELLKSVGQENGKLAIDLITSAQDNGFIDKLRQATTLGNVDILANTSNNEGFTQKLIEMSQVDFSNSPAAVEEFKSVIASIVDGTFVNERAAKDGALGFKGTVEVLGSPSMTEFIKANPDIGARYADKFGGVIEANYEQEFVPAVQRYWESVAITNENGGGSAASMFAPPGVTSSGTSVSNIPMNKLLDIIWNGSAVEFIPKPEYADNPRVVALAGDVNTGSNSIGAPLNDLIRAHANVATMSGTPTDPKTVWEQQFAGRIFGIGEEGESASPLAGDSLTTLGSPNGLVEPGNIDLNAREVVKNEDGSIGTELSMSFEEDGVEVLIPTIFNGEHHTDEEAIQHYKETGEHLGKFSSPQEADAYANTVHDRQDFVYNRPTLEDFNPESTIEFAQDSAFSVNASLPPIDPAYTDVEGINYDDYLKSIRTSESGGDDQAAAATSTAYGRYQFLKSTWNGLVNKYPNVGLTVGGRGDPNQQEIAIRLFTAENARALQAGGVSLDNGTLYAAHFLGAADAVEVLNAPPSASIADYVPSRVISANPFLRGKTVAWFKNWVQKKGNA